MKLPSFIARRYLFAKKSHNAINVISIISIVGVFLGTMAFIIILSIYNGFYDLVRSMFDTFYADIQIVPETGKTFVVTEEQINQIQALESVGNVSQALEDKALLLFEDKQTVGIVRGVDDKYAKVTGMDTIVYEGAFELYRGTVPGAVIGRGISFLLGIGIKDVDHLKISVPKRNAKIGSNPIRALTTKPIRQHGLFASQPELDIKYVIVPLQFARELFDYNHEITSLEISIQQGYKEKEVIQALSEILGNEVLIKNRFQQNELVYKTMTSEKWAIVLILALVLILASFNLVGSISMLLIEKKADIQILKSLGANSKTVRSIFLSEGIMITIFGAMLGLLIGSVVCYIQQQYGIIKLQSAGGSFVIDAYPVSIRFTDILIVLGSVLLIGLLSSWYPVQYLTKRYLSQQS